MTNTLVPETLQLRGSLFPLTILPLRNSDLQQLDKELNAKIKQAPHFFENVPIVLDLNAYTCESAPPLNEIKALLNAQKLILVGVATQNESYKTLARHHGLASMNAKQTGPEALKSRKTPPSISDPALGTPTKLVTQAIRSGQQIYAKDSDLIILGSVSPGAEVIADGNIHIYGKLSGRALAGIKQRSSRIFCREFDAELIAIAGVYRVKEDFAPLSGSPLAIQIYLEGEHLKIEGC